jgi:hypothetical protein
MIQSNELRIGNWVYDAEDEENVKVVGFDDEEIYVVDKNGIQWRCSSGIIAPIPLTEELIKKQGWEKVGYYYTDNNGLEIYETNDGWHLHIDDDKCQTTIAILINSVHELQNAYFVVTKKELEVKL